MKRLLHLGFILLLSCHSQTETQTGVEKEQPIAEAEKTEQENYQVAWEGKINEKTAVFLHYQIQDEVVVGELTYVDTKEKVPIRIIGTTDEGGDFRLMEFDKTGNITGILTGTSSGEVFTGHWFSPKTRKEWTLTMSKVDTLIRAERIETSVENITGAYHYQYTEAGRQGDLDIAQVSPGHMSFGIFSVTEDPARNMAQIETDTVRAATDFIYKVPESDDCAFRIRFFKEFAFVNYTKGYCEGMFGHNATIDGVFYKVK
ncbi:hypothetical protein GCM10027275_21060 [Rhabdobacter roseus]|uniref:Lipoprotein n=1 Tax=Rhabdobacter roseus TaxID=1655419 RepID=A0A840TVQ7_9BACT|nr:hypothetical protein [Rhabdobacter roseus]MBB5284040.1 hypothetical protein [Rhabdobacter roseus]